MKNLKLLLLFTVFALFGITQSHSQQIEHTIIQQVNVDMTSSVVLGTVQVTVTEPGKVILDFDGNCVSSDGDRIILAASNTTNWLPNDGAVAVEAYDSDINRHSFSHTRSYDIGAGTHTFYAVGQNWVETAGTGIASVYGQLTAKFYPTSSPIVVHHEGVVDVNHNVSSLQTIESQGLNFSEPGKVFVKFNGMCVSDPGDLIVIAASDFAGWTVNDGNTGTEAIDSDKNTRVFSHSRVYDVDAGFHAFYAVAQNFVETAGDGFASFYGSFTIIYYPESSTSQVYHEGVSQTNVDVEGAPVTMGQVSFNNTVDGTAHVTYDGLCASAVGDRVVMAASNIQDWSSNSGNVNVEAVSSDYNYNNFSHSRVYDDTAGSETYYAVCENFVETAGSGIASNYASLTVHFLAPEPIFSAPQPVCESAIIEQVNVDMSANVTLGTVVLTITEPGKVIVDFDGNCVSSAGDRILLAASDTPNWSVNDGHTAVEAFDSDVNRHSFSHTRGYDLLPGTHTFYAVARNFIETDGSGVASVYGQLTAKFYPESGDVVAHHEGIVDSGHNVNTLQTIASETFNFPESGKVYVKFNGMCVSDPGDLIVIAASDFAGWEVNDGNTGTEAIDNDLNTRVFSHTRVYDVGAGFNTFYAVAQNFVENEGDGIASFYASLTVIYYPGSSASQVYHDGVAQTNIDVEGAPVTMGQIDFSAPTDGKCLVTYDGLCASSVGDRVVMAASNTENWSSNSGNVNVEAASSDYNYNNFSHTRVYDASEGSNTYYAVCQNFVETSGNGIASNYASLTIHFFAAQASCDADFNGSGSIDTADLLIFLSNFGCVGVCVGDLNSDLLVNTSDLLAFLAVFGTDCP
jgi:ribosomal protein L31